MGRHRWPLPAVLFPMAVLVAPLVAVVVLAALVSVAVVAEVIDDDPTLDDPVVDSPTVDVAAVDAPRVDVPDVVVVTGVVVPVRLVIVMPVVLLAVLLADIAPSLNLSRAPRKAPVSSCIFVVSTSFMSSAPISSCSSRKSLTGPESVTSESPNAEPVSSVSLLGISPVNSKCISFSFSFWSLSKIMISFTSFSCFFLSISSGSAPVSSRSLPPMAPVSSSRYDWKNSSSFLCCSASAPVSSVTDVPLLVPLVSDPYQREQLV